MSIFDIASCEEKIGYTFKDKMLLRKCFTHASYANEHKESDNELLEFFGDAVIQLVVTEYLYKNKGGDEGRLTQKRAEIVSKQPLLKAVKKLGIEEFVLLGRGQEKSAKLDEKLFSSIYEALVAGIYLDGGMACARSFILSTLISDFEKQEIKKDKKVVKAESKSLFQEYVQKYKLGSIRYEVLDIKGPDHNPIFRVAVLLNGKKLAEGKGGNKKTAESLAASEALKRIKEQGGKKQ